LPVDAGELRVALNQMLVAGTEADDGIITLLETFV
jgi:hypothetical protein